MVKYIKFGLVIGVSFALASTVAAKKHHKKHIHHNHEFRSIDGTHNNADNEWWGSTDEQLLRKAPSDYSDGVSTPAGYSRPSARVISNEVFDQEVSIPNVKKASAMFWLWGQFIDHDIDLSLGGDEIFNIQIPEGDIFFDPFESGTQTMSFFRSVFDQDSSPRQQLNSITAYLDASMIYGSEEHRANFLRTHSKGMMKTSEGAMLPYNDGTYMNAGGQSTQLYLAGDERANENVGLTAMHTIFVHEHNYWAKKIRKKNRRLTDEQIYQRAKMIVEAEIQAITFNEYLPLLLGADAIPKYTGYKPWVNPQIANVFSTAAYRLGHTLLGSTIYRFNEDGSAIDEGHLGLRNAFFSPHNMAYPSHLDATLRGFAGSYSENVDAKIIDDVRNFLFGAPGSGGFDLAALNIQRGRDHGIADYNSVRIAYGLDPVLNLDDLSPGTNLQNLYNSIDDVDVFVGGLLEQPKNGSMLGELFSTIVRDQFLRLRNGDRFWYENRLPKKWIRLVNKTKLSDIIIRNTNIKNLQRDVMIHHKRIGGTRWRDVLHGTEHNDLMIGGKAKDVFVIQRDGGDDYIADFRPRKDKIDISAYNVRKKDLARMIRQHGRDTVITLPGNSTITLKNVRSKTLRKRNFIY